MSTDLNLSLRPATTDQFTALYAILALAGEHMHRALDLSYWHPFPSSDVCFPIIYFGGFEMVVRRWCMDKCACMAAPFGYLWKEIQAT